MTQDRKQLDPTFLGIAMTLATAAAAILAVLLPEKRTLLWILVVVFAVGALLYFRRAGLLSSQRSRVLAGIGIVAFILLAVGVGHDQARVSDTQAAGAPAPRQLTVQPSIEAKPPAQAPLRTSKRGAPRTYQVVTVSRDEIQQQLDAVPPLQRDEAAKHYVGLQVKWASRYVGAFRDGNCIRLVLACGKSGFVDTWARVSETPGLSLLKKGARITVQGTISEIGLDHVGLDPAEAVPPK